MGRMENLNIHVARKFSLIRHMKQVFGGSGDHISTE